ncbi:G-protein coupled receptor rickets [Rhipicephalus microplus]|uniref:G-protein coupled receptor rickets n=1 Tax=Rhipicephalus microplus TaxID=6941 RepID=UPI003F6CCA24
MPARRPLPAPAWLLGLTLAAAATTSSNVAWCPVAECTCSGSQRGALRVDCSSLELARVPTPQDASGNGTSRETVQLQVVSLDLSRNNLTFLDAAAFADFPGLKELHLEHNGLEWLPDDTFKGAGGITFLSLEGNDFTKIPWDALRALPALETLHLNRNHLTEVVPAVEPSFHRKLRKVWLDSNQLSRVPVQCIHSLPGLEALGLGENLIRELKAHAFGNASRLEVLILRKNHISDIDPRAFHGLRSLQAIDLSHNKLTHLPIALSSLTMLKELIISDNQIRFLTEDSFRSNGGLTLLELANNPLESFDKKTFSRLPYLKRLMVKEARALEHFPDLNGTHSLEQIRLSRARLSSVPNDLCRAVPKLKILYLMSNHLTQVPNLTGCSELLILDLTYNRIKSLDESPFLSLKKLRDLNLGNNLIRRIGDAAFHGLTSLQVLALQKNGIKEIHPDSFVPTVKLQDLNLADNAFPAMPYRGLRGLHRLVTSGNRHLRSFPPPEAFPRIQKLYLSYSYHCCAYLQSVGSGTPEAPVAKDAVLWLKKEDIDMDKWTSLSNSSSLDVFPDNITSKFQEFTHQLIKVFGQDYIIPDNLAQYYGEYLEDYKALYTSDEEFQYPVQCIPLPTPFMPCEDLFGWWTLRCGVWVVFLLAMLGNGLVVIVLSLGRSKMDVPRFLVCNLALADFFMGVYLGFLAVVDASTLGEFRVYGIGWQMSPGCQTAGFLGVLSSELSVYTLSVITMERNYAITHAMHLNKRLSLKHAGYIMGCGWAFALVMALLPLLGVSDYRKFAVCLPFETEDSPTSLAYVVFLILINGVAFLILMGCYLKMYCAIRGSQAWNSNDSRIAKRMALLVFTDFLCWAPIAFFSLTAVAGIQLVSLEEAKVFTIFVLPLNSCANPFLYAIFTKQFKRDCVLICKRIEESRVTRGIGRCRHSSNFSNRHTLLGTNSAGERLTDQQAPGPPCQCGLGKGTTREAPSGWKAFALRYLLCRDPDALQTDVDGYNYALARIQRTMERGGQRASSISSENFSSRSDSWRQGSIPLRLLGTRGGASWAVVGRKTSQDSSLSCSRPDSSTSTVRMSRSSVSSDGTVRGPPVTRAAGAEPSRLLRASTREKPQLCRQLAVDDSTRAGAAPPPRSPPYAQRRRSDNLCPACCRKEASLPFKSKEFEEKFNCFYNRLAETSHEDSSEMSKEEHVVLSTDQSEPRNSVKDDTTNTSLQSESGPSGGALPSTSKASCESPPRQKQPSSVSEEPRKKKRAHGKKKMHISVDDISSQGRKAAPGYYQTGRKVVSDNSLKKMSLKNLPQFLRSLSSHSPKGKSETKEHRLKVSSQSHLRPKSSESLPCSKSDTRIHNQEGGFQEWSQLEPIPHDGSDADRSDSNSENDEVFIEFRARTSCSELGSKQECCALLIPEELKVEDIEKSIEDPPLKTVAKGSPLMSSPTTETDEH